MIRLLVADDHPIVREGLKRIVSGCSDIRVVDEAVNGDETLARCRAGGIDVLLLDITMPGPGFLETMRQLKTEAPRVRVLVLSAHSEDLYAVRSLRAGASGYLTKDHSPDRLAAAIRRVHGGGKYVTPSLAERLAFDLEPETDKPLHEALSDREYQVLCKLGAGRRVKEIAFKMSLSPKTVSTYRARVLDKLNLENTADLVRYVVHHGLRDP